MKKLAIFILLWPISIGFALAIQQPEVYKGVTALPTLTNTPYELWPVGHLGGSANVVAVQGNYAYLGLGDELAVINVLATGELTRTGYILIPGFIVDIEVAGNYAYVTYFATDEIGAEYYSGVWVIDISNPRALTAVGVYEIPYPYFLEDAKVVGNYLYLVGLGNMFVLDISNPGNPTEILVTTYGGDRIVGNSQYLYINGFTFFRLVDITNPTNPILSGGSNFIPGILDIAAHGGYVYTIAFGGTDVQDHFIITDVSDPTNPTQVTDYVLPDDYEGSILAVMDHYVYLPVAQPCCNGSREVWVMDVSDPTNPTQVGNCTICSDASDLMVIGDQAYLAGNTLQVVNFADLNNPIEESFYKQPGNYSHLVAQGVYIYAVANNTLWILDGSDPSNLLTIASYPGFNAIYSLDLAGDFVYLGAGEQGLHIIDVSNPANPVGVGVLPLWAGDVEVVGNYAYVMDDSGSLRVVDVTNPVQPAELGATEAGLGHNFAVAGDIAYLIGSGPMIMVNVSDPNNLVVVGSYSTSGFITITVADHYLYGSFQEINSNSYFFLTLDISDPTHPVEVAVTPIGTYPYGVQTADTYLFAALGSSVSVFDISDPVTPTKLASYQSFVNGAALTAAGAGGNVYVGGSAGLTILQLVGLTGSVYDYHYTPFANVSVAVGNNLTATTGVDGRYAVTEPLSGTYTITPSLAGFAFWPPTLTVTIPPLASEQNFTILAAPVSTTLSTTLTTLTYTDTQGLPTQLLFPAGAVTETTEVLLTPTLTSNPAGLLFTSHAFDLTAVQNNTLLSGFNTPISVTITYSQLDLRAIKNESLLTLQWWDGTDWVDASHTCSPTLPISRDIDNNTITTPVCHTGRYALLGPTYQLLLPYIQQLEQLFENGR